MTPTPGTYEEVRRAISDEARRTNGNGTAVRALWIELLKLLFAALVAGGSAYLSMDHRLTAVETELRALQGSVGEVKTTLGIGVYQGVKR